MINLTPSNSSSTESTAGSISFRHWQCIHRAHSSLIWRGFAEWDFKFWPASFLFFLPPTKSALISTSLHTNYHAYLNIGPYFQTAQIWKFAKKRLGPK